MNIHTILDNMTAHAASFAAGKKKFFADSLQSRSFEELFSSFSVNVPRISGEGEYSVSVQPPETGLDPAFLVYKWAGPSKPFIIFHHGNNENPFETGMLSKHSFKMIFGSRKNETDANIIAVRAPFHGGSLKEYISEIAKLERFAEMVTASVLTVEGLVQYIRDISDAPAAVSGISLGGWVTNLHFTYFNTADLYLPLLAGTKLAEVFLTSKYKRLTSDTALDHPGKLRKVFNFEDEFRQQKKGNVFPLLGRFDQFIMYNQQKKGYDNLYPVKVLNRGHVSALLSAKTLYSFIMDTCKDRFDLPNENVEGARL